MTHSLPKRLRMHLCSILFAELYVERSVPEASTPPLTEGVGPPLRPMSVMRFRPEAMADVADENSIISPVTTGRRPRVLKI